MTISFRRIRRKTLLGNPWVALLAYLLSIAAAYGGVFWAFRSHSFWPLILSGGLMLAVEISWWRSRFR